MRNLRWLAALWVLSLGNAPAWAEGPAPNKGANEHQWKPRTKSVAVFKNGLGFFLREGEAKLRDGWCLADELPPASFGTLGIYALGGDELVDVVGAGAGEVVAFDGVDAPDTLAARQERLEASKQLKVQLEYEQHGQPRSAAGKLVSVGPEFVVLESDSNSFAVPTPGVRRMQTLEMPLRVHVSGLGADKDQAAPASVRLGMAYLRKGITWVPEYTLQILDDKTAELTLRGTLVNDAEDLVHCDVNFVVGVPNFLHTDRFAPLAVGTLLRGLAGATGLRALVADGDGFRVVTNSGASNTIVAPQTEETPVARNVDQVLASLPVAESAGGSDYTVYTKRDLTVRTGEQAMVTLFKKKIGYAHVYRWSPPEAITHFLVLQNATDTAWTTGPCLTTSAGQPLSEDLLKYTPVGGRAEIPVTAAINVSSDKTENEVDRKLKAHSPAENVFLDLVTIGGRLELRNFEQRKVEVLITLAVPGKPTKADGGGVLQSDPTQLKLSERAGTIRWRLELEPNQTRLFEYQYERYVPSN
ncbi:MAG: hypothetical protein U0836_09310 [Pirellulales bacterium]